MIEFRPLGRLRASGLEKDDLKTVSKEENFALFTLFVVGVDVGGNIKRVAWKKMISHSIQRGEIRAFTLFVVGEDWLESKCF